MAGVAQGHGPGRFADLGSGGGVPALALLGLWPDASAVLIEVGQRRAAFLRDGLAELGWSGRAQVMEARAEEVGRDPAWRQRFDLVTARSFGAPAVTAECAAPLLAVGGTLLVSEPPSPIDRWPAAPLAQLGLEPASPQDSGGYHFVALRQGGPCPERFPRRTGIPAKRPLF
ncbi:MAG: RsmG family class I SAM-dependent methyltransferase [Acidimicrobiales bacterium]